jgi:hypothetical protein
MLGLAVLLVIMGLGGSAHVSSSRAILERVHARRLIDLAAASAFEEACARLEKTLPKAPTPRPGVNRDLAALAFPPRTIEPDLTRAALKDENIQLSGVAVKSSPWRLETKQIDRTHWKVREMGMVEMTVTVTVQSGSLKLSHSVTTRRFAEARPRVGSNQAEIILYYSPIVRKVGAS